MSWLLSVSTKDSASPRSNASSTEPTDSITSAVLEHARQRDARALDWPARRGRDTRAHLRFDVRVMRVATVRRATAGGDDRGPSTATFARWGWTRAAALVDCHDP